jgi:predicted nuclease of predicted toxin-antitoxin system
MKIFVDENIPSHTVEELRGLGHDVLDIRGTAGQGMDDDVLWARLLHERRLLITTDKGFAQQRQEAHPGMLIVRLRQPNEAKIHERVLRAMRQFPEANWPGLLVVMRDSIQSVTRAELI